MLAIGAYQRAGGKTVTITSVLSDLTGRPARTFPEFASNYAAVFRGEQTTVGAGGDPSGHPPDADRDAN
jgi:hypothetical protein